MNDLAVVPAIVLSTVGFADALVHGHPAWELGFLTLFVALAGVAKALQDMTFTGRPS